MARTWFLFSIDNTSKLASVTKTINILTFCVHSYNSSQLHINVLVIKTTIKKSLVNSKIPEKSVHNIAELSTTIQMAPYV